MVVGVAKGIAVVDLRRDMGQVWQFGTRRVVLHFARRDVAVGVGGGFVILEELARRYGEDERRRFFSAVAAAAAALGAPAAAAAVSAAAMSNGGGAAAAAPMVAERPSICRSSPLRGAKHDHDRIMVYLMV